MGTKKLEQDSILVSKYINGNEDALNQLISRHKNRVYNFIYSKVLDVDVTEDIFQDTFIKVILTLKSHKYNEEGKFLPWVMRISHNLVIDYFRLNKRANLISESNFYHCDFNIFDSIGILEDCLETKLINSQIEKQLVCLLDTLPEDQQHVLRLRFFRNLSFKEIAEETGVSINTALGRMRYALINLRKIVEENKIKLSVD